MSKNNNDHLWYYNVCKEQLGQIFVYKGGPFIKTLKLECNEHQKIMTSQSLTGTEKQVLVRKDYKHPIQPDIKDFDKVDDFDKLYDWNVMSINRDGKILIYKGYYHRYPAALYVEKNLDNAFVLKQKTTLASRFEDRCYIRNDYKYPDDSEDSDSFE